MREIMGRDLLDQNISNISDLKHFVTNNKLIVHKFDHKT